MAPFNSHSLCDANDVRLTPFGCSDSCVEDVVVEMFLRRRSGGFVCMARAFLACTASIRSALWVATHPLSPKLARLALRRLAAYRSVFWPIFHLLIVLNCQCQRWPSPRIVFAPLATAIACQRRGTLGRDRPSRPAASSPHRSLPVILREQATKADQASERIFTCRREIHRADGKQAQVRHLRPQQVRLR